MVSAAVPGTQPEETGSPSRIVLYLLAALLTATAAHAQQPPAPHKDGAKPQAPLTKAQSKELLDSVDEILKFVSTDTKLPITHPVKRKLVSRDEVNRYLQKKFDEDESTRRLQNSEIVLKKFGLLERDFDLRPFLIKLLTEQIAGFYDEKTKTVNLLDYVVPEEQKPVLAHELTHALQDMRVDLVKWSDLTPPGNPHTVQEDNHRLQVDESGSAREAVTEGQAMVTFLDYSMRDTGHTLADAPQVVDKLKDSLGDNSDSPVMARAPLLLQQTLMFPYIEGLGFEAALLAKGGRDAAFAGALANPPTSTFEIIHPEAYLNHAHVPQMTLPDLRPLMPQYSFYDLGVMGELDVRILTELFGGHDIAAAISPEWDGGVYYAAQRTAATPAEKQTPASVGLIYVSRWKNEDTAHSFLRIYAGQLARKYSGLARRPKDETDEDEQVYTTTEGDVLLTSKDNTVYALEGFPVAQARTLRDAIDAVQTTGPILQATTPTAELIPRLAALLNSVIPERYTSRGLNP
ncbi:hypothetical protein [Granulicella sibirica]|uniref:Uncharacterized protein n=1 Tax=Granulicella sibirica TaxID=2479048 RepID=A0A4Q0T1P5_9BACT|nr:hypothetical protein [Granulicella sibirica]RXH57503.1 hypothetical protein GRAN_0813 [Granulicella sibirica]